MRRSGFAGGGMRGRVLGWTMWLRVTLRVALVKTAEERERERGVCDREFLGKPSPVLGIIASVMSYSAMNIDKASRQWKRLQNGVTAACSLARDKLFRWGEFPQPIPSNKKTGRSRSARQEIKRLGGSACLRLGPALLPAWRRGSRAWSLLVAQPRGGGGRSVAAPRVRRWTLRHSRKSRQLRSTSVVDVIESNHQNQAQQDANARTEA